MDAAVSDAPSDNVDNGPGSDGSRRKVVGSNNNTGSRVSNGQQTRDRRLRIAQDKEAR
jgi:hypothetical protein